MSFDFDIKKHTILLVKAGSQAYGMATDESDIDVRGCLIPPLKYVFALDTFEQVDNSIHFNTEDFYSCFNLVLKMINETIRKY